MKTCQNCGCEIATKDGENRCKKCDENRDRKNTKRRRQRRAMNDVMKSWGLVRVRGAMGGVYGE